MARTEGNFGTEDSAELFDVLDAAPAEVLTPTHETDLMGGRETAKSKIAENGEKKATIGRPPRKDPFGKFSVNLPLTTIAQIHASAHAARTDLSKEVNLLLQQSLVIRAIAREKGLDFEFLFNKLIQQMRETP